MYLTPQQVFDKASNYLRDYGNPYGSSQERGWGWINGCNPSNRCAIASFLKGNSVKELYFSLMDMMGIKRTLEDSPDYLAVDYMMQTEYSVCNLITRLFDYSPYSCNNKERLEVELKRIADLCDLDYTDTRVSNTAVVAEIATVTQQVVEDKEVFI